MAITSLNTLKNWFKTGLKPTQSQFWAWLDSFWHKEEDIPAAKIEGLQELLDSKIDKKDAITPDQVGPYDPAVDYVYDALLAEYVSFSNPASADPQFQVEGFYRLKEDAPAGENPETHPAHWVYQGTVLGEITIEDVVGLREELDWLSENAGGGVTEHNLLTGRDADNAHPQAAISQLPETIAAIQQAIQTQKVRYFRSSQVVLGTETFYESSEEQGSLPNYEVSQAIAAADAATAETIGEWVGIPLTQAMSFDAQTFNIHIVARKNATTRVIRLFADFYNRNADGTRALLGTSNEVTLLETNNNVSLFVAASAFEGIIGDRALIVFRAYQTGSGVAASAVLSIENTTYSRWAYSVPINVGETSARSYSIDFGISLVTAQEINMFGPATIDNIVVSNVASILLTWSGGLQQVITPGANSIAVQASDVLTWEIVRTTEAELATIGVHLQIT